MSRYGYKHKSIIINVTPSDLMQAESWYDSSHWTEHDGPDLALGTPVWQPWSKYFYLSNSDATWRYLVLSLIVFELQKSRLQFWLRCFHDRPGVPENNLLARMSLKPSTMCVKGKCPGSSLDFEMLYCSIHFCAEKMLSLWFELAK